MNVVLKSSTASGATLTDVLAWAERSDETRDTLCELRKIRASCGRCGGGVPDEPDRQASDRGTRSNPL